MSYLVKDITKLENIQRAFTKFACLRCSIPFTSYKDRLIKLNLKTLEYRRAVFDLIILFKIVNGQSNLKFSDYFVTRMSPYHLRGGSSRIDSIAQFKTNQFQKSFFSRVPSLWNTLPNDITSQTDINAFKHKLNQFDLNTIHKFVF